MERRQCTLQDATSKNAANTATTKARTAKLRKGRVIVITTMSGDRVELRDGKLDGHSGVVISGADKMETVREEKQ